ncbi:5-(carboxyamino)imidazole ribonucleotide mutase [Chloroflexota bacterium]
MAMVGILIGSKTDEPLIKPALETLDQLGISYEFSIVSAHRNPDKVREYGLKAQEKGIEVIIAGAGAAAHLPGTIAAWSILPVIGVPLPTSELKGIDSLYSIVQMPPGVPVACVSIGGAKNAALLAAQILGIKHKEIQAAFEEYKRKLSQS